MIVLTATITLGNSKTIEINRRNIISANIKTVARADLTSVSYGIISNSSTLSFNDSYITDEESGESYYQIERLAQQNLLNNQYTAKVFLRNTLTKYYEKIAELKTSEWHYDSQTHQVDLTLKDDLEEWQSIYIEGINYDIRQPFKFTPNKNMADIYKWLYQKTPTAYNMISFGELDTTTQQILSNTIIQYPFVKSDYLWEQWNKLCQVCGLYVYQKNARTLCYYADGS